jgi:hypothetical protein
MRRVRRGEIKQGLTAVRSPILLRPRLAGPTIAVLLAGRDTGHFRGTPGADSDHLWITRRVLEYDLLCIRRDTHCIAKTPQPLDT